MPIAPGAPAAPLPTPLVVGLGEALFDCFADRAVVGGAPVNFAIHAHALLAPLGGAALAATRVGDDDLGRRLVAELRERGLACHAVQVDPDRPTGRVLVEVNAAGVADYRFEADVAWDYLAWTDSWRALAARCDAVAFGTLAQRSEQSRATVRAFLRAAPQALRVLDVNLRGDFYSAETLRESLPLATAAKLSHEELPVVARLVGIEERDEATTADALRRRFHLAWVAVTRGERGTTLHDASGEHARVGQAEPLDPVDGADTVGAGDACCAALVASLLVGRSAIEGVTLADRVGAFVAAQPGATPRLPDALARALMAP